MTAIKRSVKYKNRTRTHTYKGQKYTIKKSGSDLALVHEGGSRVRWSNLGRGKAGRKQIASDLRHVRMAGRMPSKGEKMW